MKTRPATLEPLVAAGPAPPVVGNVTPAPTELDAIRREIDRVDADLVDLIQRRLGLAAATIEVKRRHGLDATDARREAEVVRRAATLAGERGLEAEPVREIFWRLIELSRGAVR